MILVSKEPFVGVDYISVLRRRWIRPRERRIKRSRGERGRGQNPLAIAESPCATAGVKGRVMPLNTGRRLGGRSCKQLEDLGPRSAKGCVQHSLKSRLLFSTSTSCFFMALVFMWGAGRTLPAALLLPVVQFRPLELWHAAACSL